jgi:hypothetical protein
MIKLSLAFPTKALVELNTCLKDLEVHRPDADALKHSDCEFLLDQITEYSTSSVALVRKLITPDESSPITRVSLDLEDLDAVLSGITNLRFSLVNTKLLDIPENYLDGSMPPDIETLKPDVIRSYSLYRFLGALSGQLIQAENAAQSDYDDEEPTDTDNEP